MTDEQKVKNAIEKVAGEVTENNPSASKGKCVISSAGYSECKDGLTEEACHRHRSWGVKAKWYIGEKC